MRPEDPPVAVRLVDDHVAQAAEKGGPACMGGQDRPVQHVWICQDEVGVLADPCPLIPGSIAVVGRRTHTGEAEGAEGAELVRSQCLGGGQVEDRPFTAVIFLFGVDRRDGRQQVGKRFAGSGPCGDDHRASGPRVFGRVGLVPPRSLDALGGQSFHEQRRRPRGPRRALALTCGNVLYVGDAVAACGVGEQRGEGGKRSLGGHQVFSLPVGAKLRERPGARGPRSPLP